MGMLGLRKIETTTNGQTNANRDDSLTLTAVSNPKFFVGKASDTVPNEFSNLIVDEF
jgi:hypothetical protein